MFNFYQTRNCLLYPLRHIENSVPLLIDEKLDQKDKIEQINFDSATNLLKKVLEDPSIIKVGHNIKYDMLVFSQKRRSINLYPVQIQCGHM